MQMARISDQDLLRKSDNHQFSRLVKQGELFGAWSAHELTTSVNEPPASTTKSPLKPASDQAVVEIQASEAMR